MEDRVEKQPRLPAPPAKTPLFARRPLKRRGACGLAFGLVLVLVLGLAGCGGSSDGSDGSGESGNPGSTQGKRTGTDFAHATGQQLCDLLGPLVDESILGLPVESVEPLDNDPDDPDTDASCHIWTAEFTGVDLYADDRHSLGHEWANAAEVIGNLAKDCVEAGFTSERVDRNVAGWPIVGSRCDTTDGPEVDVAADAGSMILHVSYNGSSPDGAADPKVAINLLTQVLA